MTSLPPSLSLCVSESNSGQRASLPHTLPRLLTLNATCHVIYVLDHYCMHERLLQVPLLVRSWGMSGWQHSTATPQQQRSRHLRTCTSRGWLAWCLTFATTGAASSQLVRMLQPHCCGVCCQTVLAVLSCTGHQPKLTQHVTTGSLRCACGFPWW